MTTSPIGPCAEDEDLMRLVDRQLSVDATARLRAHAAECARCRSAIEAIETLVDDLRTPIAVDEGAMVAALMKRMDREATIPVANVPRNKGRILAGAAGALSLAVAAAAIFALVPARPSQTGDGAYSARGDGTPISLRKGASVTFNALSSSTHSLEAGTVVAQNALLGADYRNVRSGASTYLLAFAIDSKNTIHWLYPAYEKEGTDPESVLLETANGPKKMPTAVLLDSPADGPLRLVSVLSEAPHHVSEIESLAPPGTSLDALRARWPDAVIDETVIAISTSPSLRATP